MGIFYTTREVVASAPDIEMSARFNAAIDSAIESASRTVEGLLHRKFYPWTGTRTKDFPNTQHASIGRVWLDADEVVSITALSAGGTAIAASDYFLEPNNSGPPYNRIEIDRASSAALASNSGTAQRSISITGVFGYDNTESNAGTLAEALDSSETAIDATAIPEVGVGSIIRVDSERMIVTDKAWLSSTQALQTPLTAAMNNVTVAVTNGAVFQAGETILMDSERMLVIDVAGNNLTVRRAVQGSVLAAHTGATIYWPRTLTVERGALGTTAATHDSGATAYLYVVPGLVAELALAYAINTLTQRSGSYARTKRSDDSDWRPSGRGIAQLEEDAYARYGRKVRMRAV